MANTNATPFWERQSGTFWLLVFLMTVATSLVVSRMVVQSSPQSSQQDVSIIKEQQLQVGKTKLWVEVKDTVEERSSGLSGRAPLADDEGMVFIFEAIGQPGFWMKDMRFNLDVLWIRQGQVVDISYNVPAPSPGTSNQDIATMRSTVPIDTALEVRAGWVEQHGVTIGDAVEFVR